jgi:hypothetical protein
MRANRHTIFNSRPNRCPHSLDVAGMTATSDVAATDDLQQRHIVRIALAQVCIQVD